MTNTHNSVISIVAESNMEFNSDCKKLVLNSVKQSAKLHSTNVIKFKFGIPIKLIPNCSSADAVNSRKAIVLFAFSSNFSEKYILEIKASKIYVSK